METTEKNPKKLRILTEREKFCLDSYSLNGNVDLAYILSREKPPKTDKEDILHRMGLRWLREEEVKNYLDERRGKTLANVEVETEEGELNPDLLEKYRSKDFLIMEYARLIETTTDAKLKSELMWKLQDLQNMRKQETEDNKETRHYYLPLSCLDCSLYVKAKEEKERERERLKEPNSTDFADSSEM